MSTAYPRPTVPRTARGRPGRTRSGVRRFSGEPIGLSSPLLLPRSGADLPPRRTGQTLYPPSTVPGFVGVPELLILLLVVLIFFGPKRLPEMGRSLGKGLREFKDSVTGEHKDDQTLAGLPTATPTHEPVAPEPVVAETIISEPVRHEDDNLT